MITWHEFCASRKYDDVSLAEMIVEYLMKQQITTKAFNRILAAKCIADMEQSEITRNMLLH
jgi:hypothetical protein